MVWLSYRILLHAILDGWFHKPKDCIGTPMAFESQVKTPKGLCKSNRNCIQEVRESKLSGRLLARRNSSIGEGLRRVKKTLMPQRGIR